MSGSVGPPGQDGPRDQSREREPPPRPGWSTATHLGFVVVITILALLISRPVFLVALFLIIGIAAWRNGILRTLLGPARWLAYGAFGIILFNLVLAPGGTHIVLGRIPIGDQVLAIGFSVEALWFGAAMALRLVVVSAAFLYLFHLLPPARLLRLGSGILPRFRLTVMMAASTYPRLAERARQVDEAFISRGGGTGGRFRRWRRATRRLLPLLEDSLEAAIDAAGFLELRGRATKDRDQTYLPQLWPGLGFLVLLIIGITLLVSGVGVFDPLVGITFAARTWEALIALVICFVPYLMRGGR